MTTSIIGYPRIGAHRELKFATEKFFRQELSEAGLQAVAAEQRASAGGVVWTHQTTAVQCSAGLICNPCCLCCCSAGD